jgi:solute carrier family 25 (mitochondrial oxoglutarate transporter), member 11
VLRDISAAGGGFKKFYSCPDAFFLRTVTYTTARIWGFLYFYDWMNPDPRRQARQDFYAMAAYAGGLVGGVLSNPFEIVFTRMQADEMYPEQCRRNYKNFADGLIKVAQEGALFRGALANGMRLGGLTAVSTGVYDWMKENGYFFFGPVGVVRLTGTVCGVSVAMLMSLPFDAVRTRLHTMRPLPNGAYPYSGTIDCICKMLKYECNKKKQANIPTAFMTGAQAYFVRLFLIAYLSQIMLDRYHAGDYTAEYWQPARFSFTSGIDYDIHNPHTDGYNQMMVRNWMAKGGIPGTHPDGKSQIKVL